MKLLVVDDSNLIRTRISTVGASGQMKGLLEVIGSARDGLEAVRMAAKYRPEVVTMDLTMPGMDGVATIGALMKMQPAPSIAALRNKSSKLSPLFSNHLLCILRLPFIAPHHRVAFGIEGDGADGRPVARIA